jgi:2-(1,2-epoxy-1,2-dihydrophenyl)acetyl-CoA isomerase
MARSIEEKLMSDNTDELLFTVEDGVALLTLNRPERRNAFTATMIETWRERLEECTRRSDVGAVVLTGAGKAFCSGGDIGGMAQGASGMDSNNPGFLMKNFLWGHIHRIALTLERLDKPMICALNGSATGAGLDMALMCDIRFCAEHAKLAETYSSIGLVPGDGGGYFLPRIVGVAKALELLWTGDFIDAAEALRLGMVSRVYPADELLPETMAFAKRLAARPRLAVSMIKRAVYQGLRSDLWTHLDLISSHMAIVAQSADHHEGVAAFLEKREPRFNQGG